MCSPTRQALLRGRNHHPVGMGTVGDLATAAPGYSGMRPNSAATIAKVLTSNGYNTAAFDKMHQTPGWTASPSGPFDRWPTGDGFEKFYRFLGGETNSVTTHPVRRHQSGRTAEEAGGWLPPVRGSRHPDGAWIPAQQALTPDKAFFAYLSLGATHAQLAPWAEKVPRWDELGRDQQGVACALMENYAGFAEHTDQQVGRAAEDGSPR